MNYPSSVFKLPQFSHLYNVVETVLKWYCRDRKEYFMNKYGVTYRKCYMEFDITNISEGGVTQEYTSIHSIRCFLEIQQHRYNNSHDSNKV